MRYEMESDTESHYENPEAVKGARSLTSTTSSTPFHGVAQARSLVKLLTTPWTTLLVLFIWIVVLTGLLGHYVNQRSVSYENRNLVLKHNSLQGSTSHYLIITKDNAVRDYNLENRLNFIPYKFPSLPSSLDCVQNESGGIEREGIIYICSSRNGLCFWHRIGGAFTWTQVAQNMLHTFEMGRSAMVQVEGKLLVTGGEITVKLGSNVTQWFDPETETWSNGTPLPEPRRCHGMVTLSGGQVMIAGGISAANEDSNKAWIYDLRNDSYKEVATLPKENSCPTLAVTIDPRTGKEIVVLAGGLTQPNMRNNDFAFHDVEANEWTLTSARFPTKVHSPGILHVRNSLIYFGGSEVEDDPGSKKMFNMTLSRNTTPGSRALNITWKQLDDMPSPYYQCATTEFKIPPLR